MNFDLTYSFMLPILKWLADASHSWGWAIIGLTMIVRILVSPLVTASTLSMRKMSLLQPQMAALQARYKEDPEQLQKKMMEFYGKNKMNPMGGCLPMLVQLPILFALYAAFSGPPFMDKTIDVPIKVVTHAEAVKAHKDETSKNTVPYIGKDGSMSKFAVFPGESTIVEGDALDFGIRPVDGAANSGAEIQWKEYPKGQKDASMLPFLQEQGAFHYLFEKPGEYVVQAKVPGIAAHDRFGFITSLGKVAKGMDLLRPENWDVLFLILAFGGTTYLSSLLSTGTSAKTPDSEMTEQQLIQKQTMKMMPVTMTIMFCFIPLPAGVFMYFVISNLFQIGQTWFIMRQPQPAIVSVIDGDEGGSGGGSGGSGVQRPGGGPKDPGGRAKGSSGGKSADSSSGSTATISTDSSQPKARIAASTATGAILNTGDDREGAAIQRKTKKKKK